MSVPDRLIFFADFLGPTSACSRCPATTFQTLSQSLSFHTLCSCFEILSSTNTLCMIWRIKVQQISIYTFCSRDKIITQNGIAVLPISCAITPSPRPRYQPI